MKHWAKVENGAVVAEANAFWLAADGWMPVHDDKPSSNPLREKIARRDPTDWLVEADRVLITYATEQLTKAERKEILKAKVETHGLALRRAGYTVNFGTEVAPNLQVLQLRAPTRGNDDEKNWMASLSAYTAAVIAGQGDVVSAIFRPASNQTITVTYSQGMAILTGLFDWVARLMQTVWDKKDAIDAADTHAELDVLEADIQLGWPQ